MSRGNAPFSSVDEAALAALASCHIQTQQAVQELARAIARDRGIELQQPQSDQPRQKTRHYRLSNMSRDGNGGLAGDLEYADGRVRRIRLDPAETGQLPRLLYD